MSNITGMLRVASFAAALAFGGLSAVEPASAQFGQRHQGGGGGGAMNAGPRNFGGGAAFNGGGRNFSGRNFNGGGRVFNGGAQVNRWAGGGTAFRGGTSYQRNYIAPQRTWRSGGYRYRPRVRLGFAAPYPVYTPYYVGAAYRTCVIRKRWVHTRHGWRKLPRRVCFRRF